MSGWQISKAKGCDWKHTGNMDTEEERGEEGLRKAWKPRQRKQIRTRLRGQGWRPRVHMALGNPKFSVIFDFPIRHFIKRTRLYDLIWYHPKTFHKFKRGEISLLKPRVPEFLAWKTGLLIPESDVWMGGRADVITLTPPSVHFIFCSSVNGTHWYSVLKQKGVRCNLEKLSKRKKLIDLFIQF